MTQKHLISLGFGGTCRNSSLLLLSAGAVEYVDYRGVRPRPNKSPGYNTKQSDGEASVLERLGIWNIPLTPLFPGSLFPGR